MGCDVTATGKDCATTLELTEAAATVEVRSTDVQLEANSINLGTVSVHESRAALEVSPAEICVDVIAPEALTVQVAAVGPPGPQGPKGDPGFAALVAETDDALVPGSAVYAKNTGRFGLARADSFPETRFAGFSNATTAPGFAATVISGGPLELTTAEWDAVTGQIGGLTPGAPYFLSTTAFGSITTVPPSAAGLFSAKVGKAITTTTLDVDPRNPILL